MKSVTPSKPHLSVRILKMATCPSLSGKSKLTYHVGCTTDAQIQFRVFVNGGTGFFSREWVSLSSIEQVFAKVPAEKCITSYLLYPLFQGRSLNTPAFLFAALKNEGLVESVKDRPRSYVRADLTIFRAAIQTLIESGADLKVVEKAPKGRPAVASGGGAPKFQIIDGEETPITAAALPVTPKKAGRPKAVPQA